MNLFNTYVSAFYEIKETVKNRKLKDLNKESFIINSVIDAIDNQNIDKIEKLNNKYNINDKNDIIFEIYKSELLNSERLQFIMKYCTKYFSISSDLIKKLFKDKKVNLLDIIFSYLKFYDDDFIIQLIFYNKNKRAVSNLNLNQQISNEKFKISLKY